MNILPFLLQVVALVCLLLAALSFPPAGGRLQWFPTGMFLWLLSLMVSGIVLHPISH
jgi:hypothetical protein